MTFGDAVILSRVTIDVCINSTKPITTYTSHRPMFKINDFPFIRFEHSLVILRISLAIFFMAHAAMRIYLYTIPSFAGFLTSKGFPFALAIVWLITIYELGAGTLLILNKAVRWAAAGLFFIAAMGIVIIHAGLGWFVGEHGTGGMEYSLCLMVSLTVIAAFDAKVKNQNNGKTPKLG